MIFSIKAQKKESIAEVELQGEIDTNTTPYFRDKLLLVCNKDIKEVIVDLALVTFMDSSGVATLVEGLKWSKKEGKSFVLKNVGTNVRNALTLTKLESVFQIMPDSGHPENPG
jgi:anti-sigma B factor antagonist